MRRLRFVLPALLVLAACSGGEAVQSTVTMSVPSSTSTTAVVTTTSSTVPTTTTSTLPSTTTTVPRSTTTVPSLTQEEAAAALEEVTAALFQAWVDGDPDAYDAINSRLIEVASSLLSVHAHRFSGSDIEDWQREFQELGNGIVKHSFGGGYAVEQTFTRLAVLEVPGAPVTLFSGVYRIGDEWTGSSGSHSGDEVTVPGTYVVLDVEDCYWERLDDTGEIIDNNFVSAAPRVEVTIGSSDFAFNSDGCGRWVRVGA